MKPNSVVLPNYITKRSIVSLKGENSRGPNTALGNTKLEFTSLRQGGANFDGLVPILEIGRKSSQHRATNTKPFLENKQEG